MYTLHGDVGHHHLGIGAKEVGCCEYMSFVIHCHRQSQVRLCDQGGASLNRFERRHLAMVGVNLSPIIRRELPETEVLALTSVLEDTSVVGAVRAGAIGYLLKDTQAEALCQAIKAAAAGQVQLTPRAAARLMRAVSAPESPEALTERETEVLRLLAQGQSNKQIAHSLNNTEKTIKTHVSRILSKLGVQSRTQATLYAIRVGLVSPSSVEKTE